MTEPTYGEIELIHPLQGYDRYEFHTHAMEDNFS